MTDTNETTLEKVETNDALKTGDIEFVNVNITLKEKVILKDVSGYCKSGELLALMGPSGAGKSTLLNTLSMRKMLLGGAKKTGSITINGVPMNHNMSHYIGYVMQDDVFFESLTLRETMRFYGKVRLPDTMDNEQKRDRVMKVLDMLELTKNLDTIIGGGLVRGLSGGERKRANIAVELISDPVILFLDEPTSGLDSGMALSLVKTLKRLAVNTGKTIVSSIHQPNSHIFCTFDQILVLSFGETHYFGSITNMLQFYDEINLPVYENWNAADYIIEMAKADVTVREKIVGECKKRCYKYLQVEASSEQQKELSEKPSKIAYKTYQNSVYNQVKALLRRNFVRSVYELLTFLNFVEVFFIAIISGIVFLRTPFTDSNYATVSGVMFICVSTVFVQPVFVSIFAFTTERHVITRERISGMYRLSSYYFAKTISELPIILIRPTIFIFIVYFMSGLSYTHYFIPTWILILLMGFTGQAMGTLFSAIGLGFRESMVTVILYMTLSLLTSGVFNKNIPIWLSWLKYISPLFHGYIILLNIQMQAFGGLLCDNPGFSFFKTCVAAFNTTETVRVGIEEINQFEDVRIPVYGIVILLLALVIIAKIATYYFLRNSLKRPPITSKIDFKLFVRKQKKNQNNIQQQPSNAEELVKQEEAT